MATGKKCLTTECDERATPRTDYCKNCNASIGGWSHRRPAEVLRRRSNLRRYNSRIEDVIAEREIDK